MKCHSGLLQRSLIALVITLFAVSSYTIAQTQNSAEKHDSSTSENPAQAGSQSDIAKRIDNAGTVFQEIMAAPDKTIPRNVLDSAKCIAIVPKLVKFAIGFGGQHGKGVATCRTANGWSAPAPISITGGSWGLQFGGEAVDLVMLVMNEKGMDQLLSSKFKIGANASAAAGPVGRQAQAATDWKLNSEVLTYSRAKGVFAGIDLGGTSITQDKDETRVLYGHMVPFTSILNGNVAPPTSAHAFMATIRRYASAARRETGQASPGTPAPSATK